MKVRATSKGVYGSIRRKEGEVFFIAKDDHFDRRWMAATEGHETTSEDAEDAQDVARPRGRPRKFIPGSM